MPNYLWIILFLNFYNYKLKIDIIWIRRGILLIIRLLPCANVFFNHWNPQNIIDLRMTQYHQTLKWLPQPIIGYAGKCDTCCLSNNSAQLITSSPALFVATGLEGEHNTPRFKTRRAPANGKRSVTVDHFFGRTWRMNVSEFPTCD